MYHCVERMIQPKCGEGRCELELYKRPPDLSSADRAAGTGDCIGRTETRQLDAAGSGAGREDGISPNTVQRAMYEMERSGLLISRGTEGKTVTEDTVRIESIRQDLARQTLEAFYREMSRLGFTKEQSLQLAETFSRSADREE